MFNITHHLQYFFTMNISELKANIKGLDATEAIQIITDYLTHNPKDDEALTLRGMKYWSLNRRADAINDYLAAIEINPASKAREAMKATYEILDFYNKDLFNP